MSQKKISDEELATLLQKGEKGAMSEIYTRYHTIVFNKCLSFAKNSDDARDMAQDIMLRVLNRIGTFKGEAKFSTWLYALTFNFCIDHTRKSKKRSFEPLSTASNYSAELELRENGEYELKVDIAHKALSTIAKGDLNLLLLKYQSNKSISEIQFIYNLSSSAVKMRLLRARAKAVNNYYSLNAKFVA